MTDDKFILTSLDDENSKYIAEVLGNKTCKKILDYLAENKEASEQDISKALEMPLNTIEYNLKKLLKAGFVEKAKNFFWSVKGKKIDMYKLARRHIIISPRNKKPSADALRAILPVLMVAAVIMIIVALSYIPGNQETLRNQTLENDYLKLKQFSSQAELKSFLEKNMPSEGASWGILDAVRGTITKSASTTGVPSAAGNVQSEISSASSGAFDYSTTNIQVEGVDEADIVKNDGKYIYAVSGSKVVIVNAYPAENMEILSEIELNQSVSEIFINQDKLIVFLGSYNYYSNSENQMINIYDISDRENPVLDNKIEFDGYYADSRMIGDYVYVISNKYVNTGNPEPPVYVLNGIEEKVQAEEVYYFDYPDYSYTFTSIMAVNIENGDFNSKVYLIGSAGNIYVSQENIYLTYTKTIEHNDYVEEFAEQIALPILPSGEDGKVKEILDSDKSSYEKQDKIQKIIQDYSNSLKGDEKAEFDKELLNKMSDFEFNIQKKTEKTVIHKINIDKEDINYEGVGEVPGHVLNQFSMDEFQGNFRIATTTGEVWGGNSLNHLYVLDEDLNIVGSVENLASGEKIYSARFIGNRAYIVTFKKIDPLFVIDLKKPEKPEVLGYLKITGYSDYLHPYDENHIIGIGKETVEAQDELKQQRSLDFAWYQGVKVSLFDVSDVENPVETAKIVIGDRGTDSDALQDHKAVLFDKEKNLLAIPIRLAEINQSKYGGEIPDNAYGEQVWQGVFVLNINENEISERGRITHDDNQTEESRRYWYYGGKNSITRSLYMDDVLYTVSNAKIKANNLENIEEINSVDLGFKEDYYLYRG